MKRYNKLFAFSASIFFAVALLYIFLKFNNTPSRLVDRYLAFPIRRFLSFVFSPFPFSVFELAVLMLPLIIIIAILYISQTKNGIKEVKNAFLSVLAVILILPTLYIFTVAIAWQAPMYSSEIISTEENVSDEEYQQCARILISDIENILKEEYIYPTEDIENAVRRELEKRDNAIPKLPRPKYFVFSSFFSSAGILAHYSFFTAEIAINPSAPQFLIPFNFAHEYFHYLGASGEADANFLAFLLCYKASSASLRYSACLVALRSILLDIYKNSPKMYTKLYNLIPQRAKDDLNEWKQFNQNSKGNVGKISADLNSLVLSGVDQNGKGSYTLLSRFVCLYITRSDACA